MLFHHRKDSMELINNNSQFFLGLDIGGTWIKGTLIDQHFFSKNHQPKNAEFEVKKVKSPLHENATPNEQGMKLEGQWKVSCCNLAHTNTGINNLLDRQGKIEG